MRSSATSWVYVSGESGKIVFVKPHAPRFSIRPSNVLGVRGFASSMGCSNLVEKADKFIHKNFQAVARTTEFLELSKAEVQDLIARDQLNVESEEVVRQQEGNNGRFSPNTILKLNAVT